jgi:hypothetical protein
MSSEARDEAALPALPPPDAEAAPPRRTPLLPERSDFLEGDAPAAEKVEAFLARAFSAKRELSRRESHPQFVHSAIDT